MELHHICRRNSGQALELSWNAALEGNKMRDALLEENKKVHVYQIR